MDFDDTATLDVFCQVFLRRVAFFNLSNDATFALVRPDKKECGARERIGSNP
jgi:hypothetical protein